MNDLSIAESLYHDTIVIVGKVSGYYCIVCYSLIPTPTH